MLPSAIRLGLLPPLRAGRRPPPAAVHLLRSDWCTGSVRKGHIQTKWKGRKFPHLASFASESWSGCASPSSRWGALSPVSSPSSLGSSSSGSGSTSSGISKRLMRVLRAKKKVKCFTAIIYLVIYLLVIFSETSVGCGDRTWGWRREFPGEPSCSAETGGRTACEGSWWRCRSRPAVLGARSRSPDRQRWNL